MQGMLPKVVVIGGCYVDISIKCDRMPSPRQPVTGSGFTCTTTGPGPNQAVQAALCGCRVHLIGKIGGDIFADMLKSNLCKHNVETSTLYTAEAKPTGTILTLVNATGENANCTCTGANNALTPHEIDLAEQVISDAHVCLIHGRLPQDTIINALRCAAIHSTKVILNPAGPLGKRTDEKQTIDLPIEYFSADILIPNLYEAAIITERSVANIRTAKRIGSELLARGTDSAVITMGKRGSVIVNRNSADHVPAFEIKLVDHTGTGDAFAGALAACIAAGDDLKNAVKFASAAGALICTKFGAMEALPDKAEIIELLQTEDT